MGNEQDFLPDTFNIAEPNHYINYSASLINSGQLEEAKQILDLGHAKAKKDGNEFLMSNIDYFLADYYYYLQEYDTAHVLYSKVLPQFEAQRDTLMLAKTLNSIGLMYSFRLDNEKELHYYLLEKELLDQVKNKTRKLNIEKIVLLTNLINLYSAAEEYHKVIENAPAAIELATELKDSLRLGSILNTLWIRYKNENEFEKSLYTLTKASAIFNATKDDFRDAFIQNNIGGLYEYKDLNLDSALHHYSLSLERFEKENYTWGITQAKLGVASVLSKLGLYDESETHYQYIIDTTLVYDFKHVLLMAYEGLAQVNYYKKEYQKAYELNLLTNELKDSLFNEDKHQQYAELETKYATSQKENKINNLQNEKLIQELKFKKAQLHKQIIISISIFLLVIIYIIIIYYNKKRKDNAILVDKNNKIELQNEELQVKNAFIRKINSKLQKSKKELSIANNSKNKFFSILAHDLRNPFHNVMGQSYLLSKTYDKLLKEERKQYADEIYENCDQVNRLLENLLEWSRTQSKGIKFQPQKIEFNEVLQNSISTLKKNAQDKNITIQNDIKQDIKIVADKEMIETIIRNLINNSIKFTPSGGQINLMAKVTKQKLKLTVVDNGIGIPEKQIKKIFSLDSNIKSSGTNNERGTGLGLVICQEFVNFHKGKIWVESELDKGSKFFFEIPLRQTD